MSVIITLRGKMSDYFNNKNLLDRRKRSGTLVVDGVPCPFEAYKYVSVSECKHCKYLTREYQRPYKNKILCDYEHWYRNVYLKEKRK